MQDSNSFMTPINKLAMYIAMAPYIGMKFGYIPFSLVSSIFVYSTFNAYRYYTKRANEKNITYIEALEEDLPDMSPIHYIFFILIAAPIIFGIVGVETESLVGVAIVWIIYAIYYYGFREKK